MKNENSPAGNATDIDLADVRDLKQPDLRHHGEYRRGYAAALTDVIALARATPQHPCDELYDVIQAVAKELDGCSFSQTKVREGNSDVWRYIGDAEALAKRVRKIAAATPQHSVTEQDEREQFEAHYRDLIARKKLAGLDDGSFSRSGAGNYFHMYIGAYWHGWKNRAARTQPLASTAATQPEQARIDKRESIADNPDAMIILTQDYPREAKIRIVDAHTDRNVRTALAIPASTAASEQAEGNVTDYGSPVDNSAASEQQPTKAEFGEYARQCAKAGTVPVPFSQFAASEQQASISDDDIERAALKHVAPLWGRLGPEGDYKLTEQFARLKAFVQELSGRATIPSDADERALFDAFMQTPAPDDYDASVDDAWLIWQEAWRAALTHRATTASGEIGCGGTGKFNDEMPCLGCDACLREGATTATVSYTTARGEAATRYHESFKHAHPLPAQWRWSELWDAMLAAAPDIATTAADQQGDTARASESQAGIIGAPLDSYSPEDQAFFKFWYSHLKDEVMQPPLAETWHSTARYIWDAALAQQGAAQAQAGDEAEDAVVEANRKLLLDRSRVGIGKYGTTLAAAGLSRSQIAQHALEEALDLANYLQTIIQSERAAMAAPATSGGGNG